MPRLTRNSLQTATPSELENVQNLRQTRTPSPSTMNSQPNLSSLVPASSHSGLQPYCFTPTPLKRTIGQASGFELSSSQASIRSTTVVQATPNPWRHEENPVLRSRSCWYPNTSTTFEPYMLEQRKCFTSSPRSVPDELREGTDTEVLVAAHILMDIYKVESANLAATVNPTSELIDTDIGVHDTRMTPSLSSPPAFLLHGEASRTKVSKHMLHHCDTWISSCRCEPLSSYRNHQSAEVDRTYCPSSNHDQLEYSPLNKFQVKVYHGQDAGQSTTQFFRDDSDEMDIEFDSKDACDTNSDVTILERMAEGSVADESNDSGYHESLLVADQDSFELDIIGSDDQYSHNNDVEEARKETLEDRDHPSSSSTTTVTPSTGLNTRDQGLPRSELRCSSPLRAPTSTETRSSSRTNADLPSQINAITSYRSSKTEIKNKPPSENSETQWLHEARMTQSHRRTSSLESFLGRAQNVWQSIQNEYEVNHQLDNDIAKPTTKPQAHQPISPVSYDKAETIGVFQELDGNSFQHVYGTSNLRSTKDVKHNKEDESLEEGEILEDDNCMRYHPKDENNIAYCSNQRHRDHGQAIAARPWRSGRRAQRGWASRGECGLSY